MPVPIIDTDQIVITASRAPESEARTPGQRHHHRPPADRAPGRTAAKRPAPPDSIGGGGDVRTGGIAHRNPHPRRRSQSHLAVRRRHQDRRSRLGRHAAVRDPECRPCSRGSRSCAVRNPHCGAPKRRRRDRRQRGRRRRRLCARQPKAARSACSGPMRRARWRPSAPASPGPSVSSARPGINSVAGPGDKDGYRNFSGRLRGTWHPRTDVEIGASALGLTGRTEFDGFDLVHRRPCRHARQQPQSPRGRADLGDRRQRRLAVAGASRGHAARLVEQELSRRRPAEPHARRSAQSLGAARTPLHDRRGRPSPDRRRRHRT